MAYHQASTEERLAARQLFVYAARAVSLLVARGQLLRWRDTDGDTRIIGAEEMELGNAAAMVSVDNDLGAMVFDGDMLAFTLEVRDVLPRR